MLKYLLTIIVVQAQSIFGGSKSASMDWVSYGQSVKTKWENRKWHVGEGMLHWVKMTDFDDLPTCYGNNPVSPYGLAMLPRSPNENTDFE